MRRHVAWMVAAIVFATASAVLAQSRDSSASNDGMTVGDGSTTTNADDAGLTTPPPAVLILRLYNMHLTTDGLGSILAAQPQVELMGINGTDLTTLSWNVFPPLPKLRYIRIAMSPLSIVSGTVVEMSALTYLEIVNTELSGFELRSPKLETLDLSTNYLVRIPESVFSFSKLKKLKLSINPIIAPLVLTVQQWEFLEAVPDVTIELYNPPDEAIVSTLPCPGGDVYGNYSDTLDLSLLIAGATETLLRGNPTLPVLLVGSQDAATYNNALEARARVRPPAQRNGMNAAHPEYEYLSGDLVPNVPDDMCQGEPRNTLLSSPAVECPRNGAYVTYDQNNRRTEPSACDYSVATNASFCTKVLEYLQTCEFHCFPPYANPSQFKFLIEFERPLGRKIIRRSYEGDVSAFAWTTSEVPFLTNWFVQKIGVLKLASSVTEVWIAGGQSEIGPQGVVADVTVAPKLLSKAPSVTSLTLLNINIGTSIADVFASPSPVLQTLNLGNTMLTAVPESVFANLPQLKTLTLERNSLSSLVINATTTLLTLTTLDLSDNKLTTIDIQAPRLETLDLSGNDLVRIPLSVFSMPQLETLDLQENALVMPLVLSSAQAAFLNSVNVVLLNTTAALPSLPPGTSTSIGLDDGSAVAGTTDVVKGVPVVVVSEQAANQYNEQLDQKQATLKANEPQSSQPPATGQSQTSEMAQTSSGSAPSDMDSSTASDTDTTSTSEVDSSLTSDGVKRNTPVNKGDTSEPTNEAGVQSKLKLGGIASACGLAVLILFFVLWRRRTADKESGYVTITDATVEDGDAVDISSSASAVFGWWRDDDMLSHRIHGRDISDVRVISSGGSRLTWLVHYRGGPRKLVSKRLLDGHDGPARDASLLKLVAEAKIACSLKYHSVAAFVGVAWTDKTDLQLLYEYMPNGDLGSYLAQSDDSSLPWMPDKLQLAIDIMEALVYTHSFNPPLLHRDLKASNVLLDEKFAAKLGGYDFARPESESNTMTTAGGGTGRWLAPEILSGSTSYSTPSDIYSFGVLLCELDTHQAPYSEEVSELGSEAKLLQCVARGELRPSVSASCPSEIREIVEACLTFDPDQRPTAMAIAHLLRSLRRGYERRT